jgi:phage gpG-like protein
MEGNEFAGGNWFQKYQTAAKKALGPESSKKEVDDMAFEIWGKRADKHGPAPAGQAAIPPRPFIMFQEEDIDAIQNIFAEWVEDKVREAGL